MGYLYLHDIDILESSILQLKDSERVSEITELELRLSESDFILLPRQIDFVNLKVLRINLEFSNNYESNDMYDVDGFMKLYSFTKLLSLNIVGELKNIEFFQGLNLL